MFKNEKVEDPAASAAARVEELAQERDRAVAEARDGALRREAQGNFTGLVLGCIETEFCKEILVGKLSSRSTQCTPLHRPLISNFVKNC